jgi:adenine-specific DNA-methyltransferase
VKTAVTVGTRIRYMGNKQQLAGEVAVFCESLSPRRRLVDLFGGMGSVAGAAASSGRSVWVNDIQEYAQLATRCLIASSEEPPAVELARRVLLPAYRSNLAGLRERYAAPLRAEQRVLRSGDVGELRRLQDAWRHAGNDDDVGSEVSSLRARGPDGPARLAVLLFAWGYFGLRQAAELDSIRYAIDDAHAREAISNEAADWLRLSLLQTASRIASAPGHFAQYLRPTSDAGAQRILAARRRATWDSLLEDIAAVRPYGNAVWRAGNRVLGHDALAIWPHLDALDVGPAIYYADPPYSKEHYSRYYHVLETLTRYDYPDALGAGRYRPDRFRSTFAVKAEVVVSIRTIAAKVAERDGILLLSYPSTGLMTARLATDPAALLSEYFDHVSLVVQREAWHSTLGGRHGAAGHGVVEYVWAAR